MTIAVDCHNILDSQLSNGTIDVTVSLFESPD